MHVRFVWLIGCSLKLLKLATTTERGLCGGVDGLEIRVEYLLGEEEEVLAHRLVKIEHEREQDFVVKVVVAHLLEEVEVFVRDFVRVLGARRLVGVLLDRVAHADEQPVIELRLQGLAQKVFHFFVGLLQAVHAQFDVFGIEALL